MSGSEPRRACFFASLGRALLEMGRPNESEPYLLEAWRAVESAWIPDEVGPLIVDALARLHDDRGAPDLAQHWRGLDGSKW